MAMETLPSLADAPCVELVENTHDTPPNDELTDGIEAIVALGAIMYANPFIDESDRGKLRP